MKTMAVRYTRAIVFIVSCTVLIAGTSSLLAFAWPARVGARASIAQGSALWQGVYTEPQARRGEKVFYDDCAYCHGIDLRGGDDPNGPPLKGPVFLRQWQGKTVEDLFHFMSETMPFDEPASLKPEEYADVISYILEANGIPAGNSELPADAAKLKAFVFGDKPKG